MLEYIILGIVQGLTEFLPVSSSGHLVIFQDILSVTKDQLALDVVLHLGTILSLLVFFYKDIIKLFKDIRSLKLIFLVTVVTGIIGIAGKDFFESLFSSPKFISIELFITGVILLLANKFMSGKRKELNFMDALIFGIAQAVAIIPGISRSGATISALLFRKVDRDVCFKFSFLASIPAIVGAAVLEAKDITSAVNGQLGNFIAGFIFSFLAGIIALFVFKRIMHKAKLHYFGYYCIIIAILTLIFMRG